MKVPVPGKDHFPFLEKTTARSWKKQLPVPGKKQLPVPGKNNCPFLEKRLSVPGKTTIRSWKKTTVRSWKKQLSVSNPSFSFVQTGTFWISHKLEYVPQLSAFDTFGILCVNAPWVVLMRILLLLKCVRGLALVVYSVWYEDLWIVVPHYISDFRK